MSFFNAYRKQITNTLIALILAGLIPSTIWIHNAYADGRYVQQTDSLRDRIQQIDNVLFEIDQEILFAESEKAKSKWQARKQYYERQKQALIEKLKSKTGSS